MNMKYLEDIDPMHIFGWPFQESYLDKQTMSFLFSFIIMFMHICIIKSPISLFDNSILLYPLTICAISTQIVCMHDGVCVCLKAEARCVRDCGLLMVCEFMLCCAVLLHVANTKHPD